MKLKKINIFIENVRKKCKYMKTKEIRNTCCIFDCSSVDEAAKKIEKQLKIVENYGSSHTRTDGSVNMLHDFNSGDRKLMQCKNCGALFLRQYSFTPCYYDDGYPMVTIVYCSINSREEALEINDKYSGIDFEYKYIDKTEKMWIRFSDFGAAYPSSGYWRWSEGVKRGTQNASLFC